jgi:hypothetical protein
MIRIFTLILSFGFSFSIWASSPQNQPGCAKLKIACEKAGFKATGKKGRKLVNDCMKKVTSGKKVKGIKLKSKDKAVTSCKEVMNMAGKRPTAKAKPKSKSKAAPAPKAAPATAPTVENNDSPAPDMNSEDGTDIQTPDIPPPPNDEDDQPNNNPIEE